MFLSDKPAPDIRRDMNGTSVMAPTRTAPKQSLRNTKSCVASGASVYYDSVDQNTVGREVIVSQRFGPPDKRAYSKICCKGSFKKKTKTGFKDRLSLNAGQKYCRML